jgi:opacity protein-like surface antigen
MNKKILLLVLLLFIVAVSALAADVVEPEKPAATAMTDRVAGVLGVFFVLSVIFEIATSAIFNWRPFIVYLDGKGWKTPITVLLALVVFKGYHLDIVRDLLVALGYDAPFSIGGQLLTSLLIAGGSDGVFQIFTKLGIRNPAERDKKVAQIKAATQPAKPAPLKPAVIPALK